MCVAMVMNCTRMHTENEIKSVKPLTTVGINAITELTEPTTTLVRSCWKLRFGHESIFNKILFIVSKYAVIISIRRSPHPPFQC